MSYESKYKTVQGEISGFAFLDAGLRKKIWDGKMVVTLVFVMFLHLELEKIPSINNPFHYMTFLNEGGFLR